MWILIANHTPLEDGPPEPMHWECESCKNHGHDYMWIDDVLYYHGCILCHDCYMRDHHVDPVA